jgi:4-hydroxy-tetrahydrodipicolinate synthase
MPLLDASARGVYIIAVTPFHDDGRIDFDSIDRLTDFYLERGVTGFTVLGQLGEAPKLTSAESAAVAERFLKRIDGRVPTIVGVSAPGLAAMGELTARVMDGGAAGVMIAPPAHLRTDDQIVGYYAGAAATIGANVPFVIQDYPLTLTVVMTPQVIRRIVEANANCVMLKHEDWPGLAKISTLRAWEAAGEMRRISILTGNGGIFLAEEMRRGADGAMTGFAFPEMMVGVVAAHGRGDLERAQDIFDAYLPFARYEQQPGLGLAIRKHVLARRGAIGSAALRAPGPKLSAADIADIDFLLARQERRLAALG